MKWWAKCYYSYTNNFMNGVIMCELHELVSIASMAGMQPEIFQGSGSIHEKGYIKTFKKKMEHVNIVVQIHYWRNY